VDLTAAARDFVVCVVCVVIVVIVIVVVNIVRRASLSDAPSTHATERMTAPSISTVARAYVPRAFPSLAAGANRAIAETLFDDADAVASLDARDVEHTVRKQLGFSCAQAIGAGKRCVHGHAQAYLYAPLREDGWTVGDARATLRAEHATCWLACPKLVRAVDALERDGGIHAVASEIEGSDIERELERVHEDTPRLRNFLIGEDAAAAVLNDAKTDFIVNKSGLIGVSLENLTHTKTWKKIKCLHAQLADALVRGRSKNPIGALVLDRLTERGVAISGSATCHEYCGEPRSE
jgi:hypothetical protein